MNEFEVITTPSPESDLKLLPCPFCGGSNVAYLQYKHAAGLRWKVVCFGCMAEIDPGAAQQRHQVQALWNRREGGEVHE